MGSQIAFWNHYNIRQTHHNKSKKSEKRQRTARISVRLLPAERDEFVTAAQRAQISVGELIRATVLQHINDNRTQENQP